MLVGSELCREDSMPWTVAARLASALARTAADLSEQRCSSRATQIVPQGAGLASSARAGAAVAAVSRSPLVSVCSPNVAVEAPGDLAGVAADVAGIPGDWLRAGVPCVSQGSTHHSVKLCLLVGLGAAFCTACSVSYKAGLIAVFACFTGNLLCTGIFKVVPVTYRGAV